MSTDGSGPGAQPVTRAQLRAMREAAARAEDEAGAGAAETVSTTEHVADGRIAVTAAVDGDTPQPARVESAASAPVRSRGDVQLARNEAADASAGSAQVRGNRPPAPRSRRFGVVLAAVVGVLLLAGGAFSAVSLLQGPRVAAVQVDPQQAIESSGSRVILTANQPLAAIDESQVTVEPAVPFTIDAAGRSVGIRFSVPLDDSTRYSVRVAGAERTGGGPSSDLKTAFTTPDSQIFLLQRSDKDDRIFTTDLTGEKGVAVFSAPHIVDFRATPSRLVVAVEEDGGSRLLVMNRDGSGQRELKLPGTGFVSTLQVADRGDLVGYSYSDADLTATSGRESVLVTQSLSGEGEPRVVQVAGKEASIGDWQFVPDTSSLLFLDFEGALSVEDPTGDAGVQPMGTAAQILGVSRGTFTAFVERATGDIVELNLTDGSEQPMPVTDPDYGPPTTVVPFPGGALQHVVQRDDVGMPTGQSVITVAPDGKAKPVFEVGENDAILQTCVSPSGQYAAVTVTPDLANNPYDELLMPLPKKVHTNLIDLRSGETLTALTGFDVSWCHTGPQA